MMMAEPAAQQDLRPARVAVVGTGNVGATFAYATAAVLEKTIAAVDLI